MVVSPEPAAAAGAMYPLRRILATCALLGLACLVLLQYSSTSPQPAALVHMPNFTRSTIKTILYWTPMYSAPDFYLGVGQEIFEPCPHTNCYATYNKDELPVEEFDAILFHGAEYREEAFGRPKRRNTSQVYVFSLQESPTYTPKFVYDYDNFYNWTMTHRVDSDVMRPYGVVTKQRTNYKVPAIEDIRKRSKKIAWFVSHCSTASDRERLYSELAKYVQIDVFGACGDLSCPRSKTMECYNQIESNYKFYLSFENSLCDDYVTEKLYNILKLDIVPIVYGRANYKELAPPNSVINVMDFASLIDLVSYIEYLDKNVEEYLKYFQWKKDYVIDTGNRQVLCKLCEKLNEPIQYKTYGDLKEWWSGSKKAKCANDFLRQFL